MFVTWWAHVYGYGPWRPPRSCLVPYEDKQRPKHPGFGQPFGSENGDTGIPPKFANFRRTNCWTTGQGLPRFSGTAKSDDSATDKWPNPQGSRWVSGPPLGKVYATSAWCQQSESLEFPSTKRWDFTYQKWDLMKAYWGVEIRETTSKHIKYWDRIQRVFIGLDDLRCSPQL